MTFSNMAFLWITKNWTKNIFLIKYIVLILWYTTTRLPPHEYLELTIFQQTPSLYTHSYTFIIHTYHYYTNISLWTCPKHHAIVQYLFIILYLLLLNYNINTKYWCFSLKLLVLMKESCMKIKYKLFHKNWYFSKYS